MPDYTFRPPANFLGLAPEFSRYEESRALVLPAPYEATTSYKGGTREGPRAIIEASAQVELYDREFDCEPALQYGIHTLPTLAPDLRSPEASVETIAAAVADLAGAGKLLGVLGGEHGLSIGVARGLSRVFGEFVTVQLDAHADLRDSYEESPYSHACTARRIVDFSPILQLGIRSLDVSEARFLRERPERVTAYFAEEMRRDRGYLTSLAEKTAGRQVFLTLDLDVLDPAIMPSVGTPEPGGLFWAETLDIIRTVASHGKIIAFDCVELAPIPGMHAPDFTAAKLVYKIFSTILSRREEN